MRIAPLLLTVCTLLFCSDKAFALKTYRCDGRIQFRPCDMDFAGSPIINSHAHKNAKSEDLDHIDLGAKIPGPRFARVDDPEYSEVSPSLGKWRGTIQGNGRIALTLQFIKNGNLVNSRNMGETYLMNSKTYFAFTSPLPKQPGWSWNIVASAS